MSQETDRLDSIYNYIKQRLESKQGIPTQREIARDCKLSLVTVSNCLSMLEARGRITRDGLKSRSIRIVSDNVKVEENETAENVYDYLFDEIEAGSFPSQQEIANACYLSRSEVRRALIWLEAQGRIERVRGQRNIRLTECSPEQRPE